MARRRKTAAKKTAAKKKTTRTKSSTRKKVSKKTSARGGTRKKAAKKSSARPAARKKSPAKKATPRRVRIHAFLANRADDFLKKEGHVIRNKAPQVARLLRRFLLQDMRQNARKAKLR